MKRVTKIRQGKDGVQSTSEKRTPEDQKHLKNGHICVWF
jgi:hypothetical protein